MEKVPNAYKQINDGEFHQLQIERQERLQEALSRAESLQATADDWAIIRSECGLPAQKIEKGN